MRYEVENPMILYKEKEPKVVAFCCECNEPLTEQDEFLDLDGEYLCDDYCLIKYLGVRKVEGWEII
jgi:hypothetical protein